MEYAVIWAEALRGRYLELLAEATARGQRQEVLAATRLIIERLQNDPRGVGEITHHLASGAAVHQAAQGLVSVNFAIYDQPRVVWLTRIALFEG